MKISAPDRWTWKFGRHSAVWPKQTGFAKRAHEDGLRNYSDPMNLQSYHQFDEFYHIHGWSFCKWSPKRHQCVCDPTGSDDRSIGFDFACILAMSFLSVSFSDATVRWQEKMVPGYKNFSPKKMLKEVLRTVFIFDIIYIHVHGRHASKKYLLDLHNICFHVYLCI